MHAPSSSDSIHSKVNIAKLGGILAAVLALFLILLWISFRRFTPMPVSPPSETPTPIPAIPTLTVTATPIYYIVQENESLFTIAEKFDLGYEGALLIYYANRPAIETYDGVFFPGQTIIIPAPGSKIPTSTPVPASLSAGTLIKHRVLPADRLDSLAENYHTTEEGILAANPEIADHQDALPVGQILLIPVNLVSALSTPVP